MQVQNDLHKLLDKEMDRKEFLKNVGVGIVALTGVGAALKVVLGGSGASYKKQQGSMGYGSSPYGGITK